MITDARPKVYYPALDGLRGLAILLVVVYHNFGFINYFFFGWLGVDLFFVLSGFLITDILLKTREQPNFIRHFYTRRLLRIFPLYYLALILFLLLIPAANPTLLNVEYYRDNSTWLLLYLQNWLYIFNPTNQSALFHFWSLAVEEQYYLLWPFAVLLVKRAKVLFGFLFFCLATYHYHTVCCMDL
ncbi:MAG TPA: acyltransferase [Chitinophagaceae bacterium]|nr:acyltransferase [Chitinophagaceae bacterium]